MMAEFINHLWQSTAFAILAGFLTLAFRRNRAQVRYWIWFSASVKFLVPFSLLLTLGSYFGRIPAAKRLPAPAIASALVQVVEPFAQPTFFVPSAQPKADWLPVVIIGLWVCGLAGVVLVRLRAWVRIRAAVRASTPLDISFPVPVRCTKHYLEPGVVGIFRPILLLPAGIIERFAPNQLQAILGHELCHVRRRDNLTAAIHMLVEVLFWFHPFVWWISARMMEERERACDESVLELGSEPQLYAESILKTCEFCVESPLACVPGVTGADLKKRIMRIMTQTMANKLSMRGKLALAGTGIASLAIPLVVGLLYAPLLRSQSSQAPFPTFEVASVKPNHTGDHRSHIWINDTSFRAQNQPAKGLIEFVYDVQDPQLSGAPAWIGSEMYDVEARIEDADYQRIKKLPSAERVEQIRLRVQSLLAERFRLQAHRETRKLGCYALVIAKDGPKLQPSDPAKAQAGGHNSRPGASSVVGMSTMHHTEARVAVLVQELSRRLGVTVLDRTGLTGKYDFDLQYARETNGDGMFRANQSDNSGRDGAPESASSGGPSIFTALQEQLGLKLERTKGPVEVIVIDHIERPTEN